MKQPFTRSILKPGDHLFYRPSSVFGWLIALKTYMRISHVEVYVGDGMSFTSRDGKGVNFYPLRTDGLGYVCRPSSTLDIPAGIAWARTVKGQAYNFRDMGTFLLMGKPCGDPNKMMCSQSITNFDRKCGFDPVKKDVNAQAISPADLYRSEGLPDIWTDTGGLIVPSTA